MFSWNQETFPVVRCDRCGLVYINPRPSSQTRNLLYYGEQYPFATGRESQPYEHYRPVIDFLTGDRGTGRVLDVGTGNSSFLPLMKERGWDVHGTEIDSSHREFFQEEYGIDLYIGELETAGFEPESFDAVTVMGVLEHIPHPKQFMEEANRVLKPGGLVGLWCFNRGVEASLLGRYWPGFDVPRHFHSFSRKTLTALLNETGFEVVGYYYRPVSYSLYGLIWAAKTAKNRLFRGQQPTFVSRLPRPLELLNLPLAKLLAKIESSANIYLFARKTGAASAGRAGHMDSGQETDVR